MSLANNIQNLQTIISSLENKTAGGITIDPDKIIEKTVSGSAIYVYDVSEVPHKCTVSVDKDASVWVGGKNLFDITAMGTNISSLFYPEDNTIRVNGRGRGTSNNKGETLKLKDFAPHLIVGETYTLNATYTHTGNFIYLTGYNKSWRFGDSLTITQVMLDSDVRWYNSTTDGDTTENVIGNIQIEKGTRATEYEPYDMTEYNITKGESMKIDSLCPNMTLLADNDATITFGYHKSYGAQTEHDRFWDALQQNGNRTAYDFGFYGWDSGAFYPKHDLIIVGNAESAFRSITGDALDLADRLEKCGVRLDTSGATKMNFFTTYSNITRLPEIDTTSMTDLTYLFYSEKLETVDALILKDDGSQTFTSTFYICNNLVNIEVRGKIGKSIEFGHCTKLSNASVQSIIDHLKDLTGSTAQTLTLHATVGAKLTDDQKSAIAAKNWNVTY